MKLLIQRVKKASVSIEGKLFSSIDQGLLVLVGLTHTDTKETAQTLAKKLVALRLFSDDKKPINASIADVNGSFLLVSQFTLYGNTKKGNRPSFVDAMAPDLARPLFDEFVAMVKTAWPRVETGKFGELMEVSLINDGPTTIELRL